MHDPKDSISYEELHVTISYDPDTGHVHWLERRQGRNIHKPAGVADKDGYLRLRINGRTYAVHRLAWFYTYGVWPKTLLDHINGKKDDNRIANLRDVSHTINNRNLHVINKDNTSGLHGVYWNKKNLKWRAQISVDGKQISLGSYKNIEDAIEARRLGEIEHWGHNR